MTRSVLGQIKSVLKKILMVLTVFLREYSFVL
jgi:hypothetical protein